jgi:hypothetical protein
MPDPAIGKLTFRAVCDKCGAALHCCRNCIYYQPGLPNDCRVPNTDFIADRTATNFCEEFSLKGKPPQKGADVNAIKKKLFGDDDDGKDDHNPKGRFDSLFRQ